MGARILARHARKATLREISAVLSQHFTNFVGFSKLLSLLMGP